MKLARRKLVERVRTRQRATAYDPANDAKDPRAAKAGLRPMERYFFHIEYGEYAPDLEGLLLPSMGAARAEAVKTFGELSRDLGDAFGEKPGIVVTVADEWGLTLMTVEVSGEVAPAVASKLKA